MEERKNELRVLAYQEQVAKLHTQLIDMRVEYTLLSEKYDQLLKERQAENEESL